ncbi:hypothetical protein SEPCBS119000_004532 [Sporothrix epigloea]|uniref:C3H1-type domain-containing protein n=1 Tax=Sporothrix epigloea TaxID=1892477 RepID=A0ABP0DSN1_9PEZI
MSAENQELLARISQLAGQINRHKNQQAGISSVPSSTYISSNAPLRGRGAYSARGRGGGYRVQKPAAHRHRTLVLNGSGPLNRSDAADSGDSPALSSDSSSSAWVARTDRHRQLINADVYEKDAQIRARAIEHTRLLNLQKRDARERAKLQSHLAYLAGGGRSADNSRAGTSTPSSTYQLVIEGISFSVAKNGSKLVKVSGASAETSPQNFLHIPSWPLSSRTDCYGKLSRAYLKSLTGDTHAASSTPKTAIVGGVKFYRSKNGNMYRHGVVRAQQRYVSRGPTISSCSKGPNCRFVHDATKTAICKEFLLKGACLNRGYCDLSHELTPERTPFCVHYAKGNCTNPQCSYTHSQVSSGAPVCRPFGLYGYCERGAHCNERHVFECPDFSNTGVCKIKGCKLPHRERASFMRRAGQNNLANSSGNNSDSDLSSDDESVNSDDIDSDEVDEFVGPDGDDAGFEFAAQKDYVEI